MITVSGVDDKKYEIRTLEFDNEEIRNRILNSGFFDKCIITKIYGEGTEEDKLKIDYYYKLI